MPLELERPFLRTIDSRKLNSNADYVEEVFFHYGDEKRCIGAVTPSIMTSDAAGNSYYVSIWGSETALPPFDFVEPAFESLYFIEGQVEITWPDGKIDIYKVGDVMSCKPGEKFHIHWTEPFKVVLTSMLRTENVALLEDQRLIDADALAGIA